MSYKRDVVFNPKDYGVVADGTTNDVSALNSLITTVSGNGGGVILLPIGTVKVNSPINMASDVTLRGQGWKSIIKLGANINGFGVITITGAISNIVIENLKIDGQSGTLTLLNDGIHGLNPGGYSDITVRNVWVDSCAWGGITFLGDSTRAVVTQNIHVENCKVTNVGYHGILSQWGIDRSWIQGCNVSTYGQIGSTCGITNGRFAYDTYMLDNYVDCSGVTVGPTSNGVSVDNPYGRFVCRGNTVIGGPNGIGLEIGYGIDGSVTENHIVGGTREGIAFTGDATGSNNRTNLGVTVANNTIDGALKGIGFRLSNTTSAQDIPASLKIRRGIAYSALASLRVVNGKRIYECTTAGTSHATTKPAGWNTTNTGDTVTDGTSVWTDRGPTHAQITITGNIIRNCTDNGIEVVYAHELTIVGNTIVNNAKNGIYIGSNANMFTINNNIITGNNLTNSATQAGIWIVAYAVTNASAHVARIYNNLFRNNLTADYAAVDTNALRLDNRLINQATQPTVAYGSTFFTQNTVATTITNFQDSNDVDGRVITLRINDALTTLQHSASGTNSIRLLGGANFSPSNGTVLQFVFSSALVQWLEVSRVGRTILTVTTTTTLGASGDYIILLGASGLPTLPTAVGNTSVYQIKNTTGSAINLATTSAQTIDGAAGPLSIAANAKVTLVSNNANWFSV